MKHFLLIIGLILSLCAKEWKLVNVSLTTENDADFRTDRDYTYGSKIETLFQTDQNSYKSISIAHKMFTPNDFDKENIDFSKERPYAGYSYLNYGVHNVKNSKLDSWTFQVGFTGPSTKMDQVQKMIHSLIGSPKPKGWNEQIGDELILQINFERRLFYELSPFFGNSSNLVTYAGGDLGNASIKGVIGVHYRIGWNMQKDFAPRRLDYRGYSDIPLETPQHNHTQSFWFGLWAEPSIIGRDIFLDGNTFKESVHVDKEVFVAKGGFSLGYRYKKLVLEYFRTFSTKEFTTQNYYHHYGSLRIAYNF